MRRNCFALLFSLSAITVVAAQIPTSDIKPARVSIDAWLSLIDKQSYGESWDEAGSGFKAAVKEETWQGAVSTARSPLGAVKSRTLKSAAATTTLPGAPPGDYVVFQFDSVFENRQAAVETVIAAREKDGAWRVVGYSVT